MGCGWPLVRCLMCFSEAWHLYLKRDFHPKYSYSQKTAIRGHVININEPSCERASNLGPAMAQNVGF